MPLVPIGTEMEAGLLASQIYTIGASGALSLTASLTDVPGASITVTAQTNSAIYLATWTGDFQSIGTTATLGVCQLMLDGAFVGGQALYNMSNVAAGARCTASQHFAGVLATAGSHTFKLQAARATGANSMLQLNSSNTSLTILVLG